VVLVESEDLEGTCDYCHYERTLLGRLRAINHQPIARLYLLVSRSIALDPHEEGGGGIEEPYLLELEAVGELTGTGRWELKSTDEGTLVHYYWDVKTTKTCQL
jgi:hypothetical protein